MRIHKQEKDLLDIKQISNIESIELKDIYQSNYNGHNSIVPGFMITYGEPLKFLYLTTQDKYFEDYAKRVRETYLEEKDKVISEGILGKKYILIDPITKSVLLNGGLENLNTFYQLYDKQDGYNESLLFQTDRIHSVYPIIEEHLRKTLANLDVTLGTTQLSIGNTGIYYIDAIVRNEPRLLPIYYEEERDSFHITIGNLTNRSIPMQMDVNFTNDGYNVHCYINEFDYSDYTDYSIKNHQPVKEREIYYHDKLIHWETTPLEQILSREPVILSSLEEPKDLKWYLLPNNGYIGLNEKEQCIEDDGTLSNRDGEHRLLTKDVCIIYPQKDLIFMKDVLSKSYYHKTGTKTISQYALIDKIDENSIGIIANDGILFERNFNPWGPQGFYKKYLAGKYFYQTYDKDLNKESCVFLNKQKGIEESSDLLDSKIYKKGR